MDPATQGRVEAAYSEFKAVATANVPGQLLLTKVWGSHSHNCALPTSDIDYLALYRWPLEVELSLQKPAQTIDHKGPDWQAHEIGKFCALLMKGNPATVECLFTEHWCDRGPELQGLLDIREIFINRHTLNQYLGYGRGQLRRLNAGSRLHSKTGTATEKWSYHMLRMAYDARRIAQGRAPAVWREDDDEERQQLMRFRSGQHSVETMSATFWRINDEIDRMEPLRIPEAADEALVNRWLYQLRVSELGLRAASPR